MKTVSKSQFKAHMSSYFREVEETGEELVVTSYGKPAFKVIPASAAISVDELFSEIRKAAKINGDMTEPENDSRPEKRPP
jgi:prevent-host-death family protein